MTEPLCSVERKCSSIGRTCSVDDRACQSQAVANGLEVTCERREETQAVSYVYCPPGGQQRDSGIVWILLLVALVIAAGGSVVAWLVLRKPVH